jgi:hypothetical protein
MATPAFAAPPSETPPEHLESQSASLPGTTRGSGSEVEGAAAAGAVETATPGGETNASAAEAGETAPAGPEYRVRDDDIYLTLGGFLVTFKTEAGASFGGLLGTRVNVEDDLGVDDNKSTFRLDGFWRFKPKHSLGWSWFALNRSGFSVLDEQIEFEDVIFEVGAAVDSRFETDWFGLDYRYSLLQTERGEAGIRVGVSTYGFDLGLAGRAIVDDGSGPQAKDVDVEEGIVAPVPIFGFFLGYGITPCFYFRGDVALFRADMGDWSLRLLDSRITFDYFFSRHVGLGFGINGTDIDVTRSGSDPFGVDYRQSGLLVYLSLGF